MDILRVQHCSVRYKDGIPAVDDVSFRMAEGEIVSIVGESGSGKTTLIRAILGILPSGGRITQGSIWFRNRDIANADKDSLQALRGKAIGMIFQDPGGALDPIQRIEPQYIESIRTHEKKLPATQCRELARAMLRAMQLTDADRVLQSYPCELSGGMKQRVGIAIAMTAHPQLLLADEPTSALDVTIQAQVVHQMKELQKQYGTAIVMVTHNMGVASFLSDKIGVMKDGKLVEWGSRDEVIFNPKHTYTKALLAAVPKLEDRRLAKQY